jgi:hypothetical protein
MSRFIKLLVAAALVTTLVAGTANAAKVSAKISFASATDAATAAPKAGGTVSFSVNASAVKQSDLYFLWVANLCYQNGNLVYARYLPIQNPGSNGLAGAFSLDWSGGGAAECMAYVWMFPQSSTPLRGASMTYSVGA